MFTSLKRIAQYACGEFWQARATVLYVFALAVTTFTVQGANPRLVYHLIVSASTNVHNMAHHPVQVMISSAFWLQGGWPAWTQAGACVLIMVPAERWLGSLRWATIFAAGHIGATLLTVTGIAWGMHQGLLPGALARTVDVGMSYGVAALIGVLTYRWPHPGVRLGWAACWLAYLGSYVVAGQTFTDYGHLLAILIGFLLYPLTLRAGRPIHPRLAHFPSPIAGTRTTHPSTGIATHHHD